MRGISARDRSRRVVRFATHDCCTGVLRPGFRPSVGWATKPNAGIPTEINVGLHFIQPDLRVCATRHSRRDLPPPRPSTASGGGRQASHCAACANGKCRLGCKAQRGNPDRQESTLGFISFSPTYASAPRVERSNGDGFEIPFSVAEQSGMNGGRAQARWRGLFGLRLFAVSSQTRRASSAAKPARRGGKPGRSTVRRVL